jgi:uncharacterized protein YutE (UPF0331/DUF86 family)
VTDKELIAKKLALIETCVQQLRQLARPAAMAAGAGRSGSSSIRCRSRSRPGSTWPRTSSRTRLGEPRTNRELFDLLERGGWVAPALTATMRQMVGFWNILVHGYEVVDVRIVIEIVEHRLDDLLAFVAAIRARLS